ncbi:MAG: TonB-dependent receptor plug domain-containing protein [Bacteroidales bacterium]|nr:TonB-dependent receptor plug domain-containing protein [Bacteroidales bacterium]
MRKTPSNNHRILLLLSLAVLISYAWILPAENPVFLSIIEKFEAYFTRLPQQKVFLDTDKSAYKADETLWFKANLVNAKTHLPDSSTNNLYVDLINPSGFVVQSKLIRMTRGFGNGDFSFKDTVPEGIYKIRAFTNWMRNTGEDYYFEKEFYLANPDFSTYITSSEVSKIKRESKKYHKKESSFDVQFLPEGGHLLANKDNVLGIKAINDLGHGIAVKGEILDSKGNLITEFSSSEFGLGSVHFRPEQDQKYTAIIQTPDSRSFKKELPEAILKGLVVHVKRINKDEISAKLLHNFMPGDFPANTRYFLLGHIRGNIVYRYEFDLSEALDSVTISTSDFPTGILHLTLFNLYSQPVSERLVFINNKDFLNIHMETAKNSLSPREKAMVKISVSDKKGNPVEGSFSVSIANAEDIKDDQNIVSNLLLDSDLKGKIENPAYYFSNWNPQKEKELDDLMLTNGWSRFSWPVVLSDNRIPPKFENEHGISISGKITRELFDIPLRDIKVTMSILNEFNDVFTTRSREKGIFSFDNLDYSDTVSVSIEAVRASGRHNLVIYLDEKTDSQDKNMHYQTKVKPKKRGEKGRYVELPDPSADDPYAEQNSRLYRIHQEPTASNVIIVDEKYQAYANVGEIIQGRIAGVNVSGNHVNIRGNSSYYGNTDPLFLVDGMPVDAEYALGMNPMDVERIEVLKGNDAAIYGSRAANGVIAIYTKRGKFMKKGILDFEMLGYATPKEYYKPKYEYRADDPYEDDRRTIFWMPYLLTDSDGRTSFEFYTSDIKGPYVIKVEGLSDSGIPGFGYMQMEVK